MKAETFLARFFSVVFHPLFIPTISMILLFRLNSYISYSIPYPAKRFILVTIFLNTALAPALAIYILKRVNLISNLSLHDRNERLLPLMVSALLFILTYTLFKQISLPSLIYFYMLGGTTLILFCLIISFRWKISLHMASMGGFTGFLISISLLLNTDLTWLIMLSFLMSGLVGTSRLLLKAHSPGQVYAGFLLGFVILLGLFFYLKG